MYKLKGLLFFITVLFVSCNSNSIYNEFNSDFDSNRWNSNEEVTFEFNTENDIKVSSIKLHIGHIYDFQFSNVPMKATIISPDGSSETINLDVIFKDETGKDLADCIGDICDLYVPIKNKTTLIKGNYKFVVENKFSSPFLPNILGIGILIEK
jgi:gliding motility-associated lipoprotein GldH